MIDRLVANPEIAERTIKMNYYANKYLIDELLDNDLMAYNSSILNMASFLGNIALVKNKEAKQILRSKPTIEALDSLIKSYIDNLKKGESFINLRHPVPEYIFSKILLRAYTYNLSQDKRILEKNIKAVSLCPGWVKTSMGGEQAQLTVEESVKTFASLLDKSFFIDRSDYEGHLVSNEKVFELK